MGKTTDWTRIFNSLEYFLYGASIEWGEDEKIPYYSKKEGKLISAEDNKAFWEERVPEIKKMGRRENERLFQKTFIERMMELSKTEERIISSIEKGERNQKNTQLVYERLCVDRREKLLWDYYRDSFMKMAEERGKGEEEAMGYEVIAPLPLTGYQSEIVAENAPRKMGRSERERIVKSSLKKDGVSGGNVKLEMHNVNNLSGEVDIEKVTDMLTDRLYEMMQKSTDGFYM